MLIPERFTLTQGDRASDLWYRLTEYLKTEREKLRARNDTNLDPSETAIVRGQIQQINKILALGKDPIVTE